jgi:hypothetical protein
MRCFGGLFAPPRFGVDNCLVRRFASRPEWGKRPEGTRPVSPTPFRQEALFQFDSPLSCPWPTRQTGHDNGRCCYECISCRGTSRGYPGRARAPSGEREEPSLLARLLTGARGVEPTRVVNVGSMTVTASCLIRHGDVYPAEAVAPARQPDRPACPRSQTCAGRRRHRSE